MPTVFSCVASRNKQEGEPRPGLPRAQRWSLGICGTSRRQLVVFYDRLLGLLSLVSSGPSKPQRCERSGLRFSVALPLGINAACPRRAMGWNYPNNWQPLPHLHSCDSQSRAGRSLPQRRPATNVAGAPQASTLNIHSRRKWVGRPGGTATFDAQAACCGPSVGRRPARATRWVAKATPPFTP